MFRSWSTEKLISITLAYMLCFPAISGSISNVTHFMFGESFKYGTYVVYFVYLVLMVAAVQRTFGKMSEERFAFAIFVGFSLMLSYTFCNIQEYLWTNLTDWFENPLYTLIFFGMIGFFLSDYMDEMGGFLSWVEKFSILSVALALLWYGLAVSNGTSPEYMTFSYNILLQTLVMWLCAFTDMRWYRLLFGIVGMLLIFFAGCRGALVCLVAGIILYVLFFGSMSVLKRVGIIIAMVAVTIFIVYFWSVISTALVNALSANNISSRTLTLILQGDFTDDSGRMGIRETIMEHVGLFLKGLYADRKIADIYSHNIVVELLIDYGVFLGALLIIILVAIVVRSFYCSNHENRILLCALFAAGLMKLFFSGSFLNGEPVFYIYLGVCLNSIRMGRSDIPDTNYEMTRGDLECRG